MSDSLLYPEYTEPWFQSGDVVLAASVTDDLEPTDLVNNDFDLVVDKIIISDCNSRDPASDYGADTQLLGDITGYYWFRRYQTDSLPTMPVVAWDNGKLDRTLPIVHGMQEPEDFSVIGTCLRKTPIIIPRNGVLTCEWENPTIVSTTAVPAGTFYVAAFCRGQRTRRPTTLYLPVTFTASAGSSATGPTGRQTYQDSSRNRHDEPLVMQDLRFWVDGDYGAATNYQDCRLMRHLLVRPLIQPGNICLNASDNLIPMIGFGKDRQLDHSVVTMDWSEEPYLLERGNGIGFRLTNNSATTTRIQVIVCGRRRPTR